MRWLIVLAGLTLSAPPSLAATVVVNQTLDLTWQCFNCLGSYITGGSRFSAPFNVDLAVGDTLDLTIDFAGLQQLTVTNLQVIFASIWTTNGQQGANITQTGTVSFLSASGSTIYTTPVNTTFDGSVHAGQYLGPNQGNLGPVPSTLTFGGVRYVGTVDAYTDGYTTRNYDTPAFYVHGISDSQLSFASPVPEVSTWTMLLLGFAGVGAISYRRSRKRDGLALAS